MTPEENGEIDNATLLAIMRGDHGPEVQAEALEAAGLQFEGNPEAGPEAGDDSAYETWMDQVMGQKQQLEKEIGRQLTGSEFRTLADDQYHTGRAPDLKEAYSRTLGRNTNDPDDRRAVAAEVYDELEEQKQQPENDGYESAEPNTEMEAVE